MVNMVISGSVMADSLTKRPSILMVCWPVVCGFVWLHLLLGADVNNIRWRIENDTLRLVTLLMQIDGVMTFVCAAD